MATKRECVCTEYSQWTFDEKNIWNKRLFNAPWNNKKWLKDENLYQRNFDDIVSSSRWYMISNTFKIHLQIGILIKKLDGYTKIWTPLQENIVWLRLYEIFWVFGLHLFSFIYFRLVMRYIKLLHSLFYDTYVLFKSHQDCNINVSGHSFTIYVDFDNEYFTDYLNQEILLKWNFIWYFTFIFYEF